MKIVVIPLLMASALLTGCAYNASPYGASIDNVEAIKSSHVHPVAVEKFTSTQPGRSSIVCRAAGPVKIEPNFESYIEKAFTDELKLAGAYDPGSNIKISGKLESVDFSSGMTDGAWIFTLAISNNRNEGFTTQSSMQFSGSFVADKACQEVAQAFGPSVQKLIHDVVISPQFKKITSSMN